MSDVDFNEILIRELAWLRSNVQEQVKSLRLVNLQLEILGKVTRDLRNKIMCEPQELYLSAEEEGLLAMAEDEVFDRHRTRHRASCGPRDAASPSAHRKGLTE